MPTAMLAVNHIRSIRVVLPAGELAETFGDLAPEACRMIGKRLAVYYPGDIQITVLPGLVGSTSIVVSVDDSHIEDPHEKYEAKQRLHRAIDSTLNVAYEYAIWQSFGYGNRRDSAR
jgi:hypothetical protein